MITFSERIGGILVAPVSTMRELVRQPGGRGASDVALLLAARRGSPARRRACCARSFAGSISASAPASAA